MFDCTAKLQKHFITAKYFSNYFAFFLVMVDDGINTTFASYYCLLLHKQRASLPYLKNATG